MFGKLAVSNSAEVRVLRQERVGTSLSKLSARPIHLSVLLSQSSCTLQALLDSGASINLIHESVVKSLKLKTRSCSPTQVSLADGRTLPHANAEAVLDFSIAGVPHQEIFLVAPIGIHSMILGMPWLERVNPLIDWRKKVVTPRRSRHKKRKLSADTNQTSVPPKPETNPKKPPKLSKRKKNPNKSKPPTVNAVSKDPSMETPKIRLTTKINSNDQVYLIWIDPVEEVNSFSPEAAPNPETQIPEEYKDLAEVFSKEKAHELPPNRGPLDHHIPLEKDSKPTFGPIYNLSELELTVLKKYIDEHLTKGFIRRSTSPFGAPVLFVKKPNGDLRLCIDYRALNKITIKNRHPLPLITEIFDRVKGAKYFTKLDVLEAYNRLRIALGHEWKTAFRTRYGHFEYLVMPFGLTNTPASFQSYINDAVREYLDEFCTAYMDDVLIYSNTLEEHVEHVRKVLKKLLDHGLYVKLEKCEFHKQRISFLGYIISPEGIEMEPSRISTITEWPVPKSVHDIQVFLGFANFYRRFIHAYSRITLPITKLLKKGNKFSWTSETQEAFDLLKTAFTTAPILRHFDPQLPIFLYTDSSGFALSGILCQLYDGQLHPIAFWSRKCIPAECNYDIGDREMLAVVESMKHWCHYLEGAKFPISVISDHKALEVFMTTKLLNRRQARWAELLSGFDFVLEHTPGGKNPADGPFRRPDYAENIEMPYGALIPRSALRYFPQYLDEHPVANGNSSTVSTLSLENLSVFTSEPTMRRLITDAYATDSLVQELGKEPPQPWSWQDGLLLHDNLIYVPHDDVVCIALMEEHHDAPLAGHFGVDKTLELVSRNYWFPQMRAYIKSYVETCDPCSRGKAPRHLKHGELAPLPVPSAPWKGITCDFVTDLPVSNGYDSLLVFVDRLTKMCHLVPCLKTTTAPEFAKMFLDNIIRLHGIPDSLVSDRGSIFTSRFWKSLSKLMGLKQRLSTSFHPQTDGQTERMNQTVEQYLRIYCNYQQDNWFNLLPIAEFAYNNAFQPSINCSPFYANYSIHPSFHVDPRSTTETTVPAAKEFADRLKNIHDLLVENVKSAQDHQARYYDRKHKRVEFSVGEKVWLLTSNIHTERPSKKLDWKRIGPYSIVERIGTQAYRLQLPQSLKVHPVFHVSLLEPYKPNTIVGRLQEPPPPVISKEDIEYEVEEILDSKFIRKSLFYLVKWKGYPISDNSWEPLSHLTNAQELISQFHNRYPQKPQKPSPAHNKRLKVNFAGACIHHYSPTDPVSP